MHLPSILPPPGHSRALSIPLFFLVFIISDCEMYSLSFVLSQCVLEFVTQCYLLCLTTWCKVLDSLYFGCAEWVFGSGENSAWQQAKGWIWRSELSRIFLAVFHRKDNSYIFLCLCFSAQQEQPLTVVSLVLTESLCAKKCSNLQNRDRQKKLTSGRA